MDLSKIISAKMPTKETMVANSEKWFSVFKGISMDEWNDNLKKASFPFEIVRITPDLAEDMVNGLDVYGKFFNQLAASKIKLQKPFFAKLITRSPKDYTYPHNIKFKTEKECFDAFQGSLRVAEDLCMLANIDRCDIVFRPYISIPKETEFRVFIYGNKIVGISQYHYDKKYSYILNNSFEIGKKIYKFVNTHIIPNVDPNHYVLDVCLYKNSVKLIEINPFGLSDPCLFKDYASLDGTFKYTT